MKRNWRLAGFEFCYLLVVGMYTPSQVLLGDGILFGACC